MSLPTRLRNSFVAGLFLVTPLAVTVFVLQFVFDRVALALRPLVVRISPWVADALNYQGDIVFLAQLLAALLLAAAITAVGFVASRSLGRRLFGGFERGVRLVPMVRTVYFGVRQVAESLTERSARYESVVLVEYPREGVYSIGFVTNESPRVAKEATGADAVNVFFPNSPNPTAGRLALVDESEVYEVDMSVRRGIRLLVTTGLTVEDVDELPAGVAR
ncbi:DUF502 domain-containing protein [Halobium salinum]|uniref:DUF502 domain-containing protein n=1 Tax=Halobium salinum TaxID=1364940 RepID=A0ABD5PCL3_9EURY|nr:DUF502 domain-containing protein [Halobium salinum]